MDFKFRSGFTCLLFVFFNLDKVTSLQCYVCNSKNENEEGCLQIPPDDVKFLQNCTAPKDRSCRIILQWLDFEGLNQEVDKHIVRQCSNTVYDANNPCYFRTGYNGRIYVCNCEGHACNSALGHLASIWMTVLVFVLAKVFV